MNKAKLKSRQKGPQYLKERFVEVENAFIEELKRCHGITQSPSLGEATEAAWIDLLNRYLPSRYRVDRAFAVDHLGNTTDQLDCLIYDAHFTPALYGKGNHLYVPAEAVYATFEIKQNVSAVHLGYAAAKVASLRALKRTSAPLKSAQGVSSPKPLFPIIGGLLCMNASWKSGLGATFLKQFNSHKAEERLDFVLTAESGFCDRLESGKAPVVWSGSGSLIRGLFRLLQALRDQATVTAIEWDKYEAVLDDCISTS